MASTAEKLDPELWEQAKADARDAFGGHSARAMQLAVKLYKQRGGRYRGPKKKDNRLTQWSRQDWKTKSGRPSRETGERYLPAAAIESLTPAEYGATTRAKRRGGGVGSVVAQPQSIREKTRKFRKVNPDMATAKQIAARKKFAERARSGELARMRKKSTRKKNPAATVSDEISAQMRKGKPQKQAVAIALEMERAGKLKKNPISDVAQTIYQQLGANRFVAMTGAKNFVGGEDYLMFSIPRNMSPYNKVKITYVPGRDLYDVDFMKVTRAGGVAKGEPYNDVYAEQLRELFTSVTGMETSLGTMGRRANPTATRPGRSRTKLVSNGGRKSNPRQRMGKIAFLSAGGEMQIKEVPIDFSFKQYVGNIQEDFFARTENGFLIVTEKSTGFKVGQVPHTMRAAYVNDRAAAKRFVESVLERVGADAFRKAIMSKPKIA